MESEFTWWAGRKYLWMFIAFLSVVSFFGMWVIKDQQNVDNANAFWEHLIPQQTALRYLDSVAATRPNDPLARIIDSVVRATPFAISRKEWNEKKRYYDSIAAIPVDSVPAAEIPDEVDPPENDTIWVVSPENLYQYPDPVSPMDINSIPIDWIMFGNATLSVTGRHTEGVRGIEIDVSPAGGGYVQRVISADVQSKYFISIDAYKSANSKNGYIEIFGYNSDQGVSYEKKWPLTTGWQTYRLEFPGNDPEMYVDRIDHIIINAGFDPGENRGAEIYLDNLDLNRYVAQ